MVLVHLLYFAERNRKGQQIFEDHHLGAEEGAVNTLSYGEEEPSTVHFVDVVIVDAEVELGQRE
jgi:hypothetical protein